MVQYETGIWKTRINKYQNEIELNWLKKLEIRRLKYGIINERSKLNLLDLSIVASTSINQTITKKIINSSQRKQRLVIQIQFSFIVYSG